MGVQAPIIKLKVMEEKKQERKKYPKRGDGSQQKMVSFRLDQRLMAWLNSKANKGRYINNLIARDMRSAWIDDEHSGDLEKLGDFEEF